MTKLYTEKKGSADITSGNSNDNGTISFRLNLSKEPAKNTMRLDLFRPVYLILILTGLAGTLYIIYNVISTRSVDSIHMVLVFLLSCIPLTIMAAGLYGFSRTPGKSDRYS
jgi:hypothetical protein